MSVNTSPLLPALARGPSLELLTSAGLGWKLIEVGRYIIEPGEKAEVAVPQHVVTLASGPKITYGKRASCRGQLVSYFKHPGVMDLHLDGSAPAMYPATQTELTMCAIDPKFVAEVAAEQDEWSQGTLTSKIAITDQSLSNLVQLIENETRSRGASGQLYLDSLLHALSIRLLFLEKKIEGILTAGNALSLPRLKRVIDLMHSRVVEGVDLKTLAAESGYSRNHFSRMFQAATG